MRAARRTIVGLLAASLLAGTAIAAPLPTPPVDVTAPAISTPLLTPATVPAGSAFTVTATATDNAGVKSAQVSIDGGLWTDMSATDGAFGGASEAVSATLPGALSISSGAYHTCALLTDGTVRCWGQGTLGQLGNGTEPADSTPVQVTGITNAVALAAGYGHTCVVLADHTIRCWGVNDGRQLGDGTYAQRSAPVTVPGISPATAVTAGQYQTCALLANGTVSCWGFNGFGLGDGVSTDSATPVVVSGITTATSVTSSAGFHSCATLLDGTVWCWGRNHMGQLGIGSADGNAHLAPVQVSGITNAVAVSAGTNHTCALLITGAVKCWGFNNLGQLNDGTVAASAVPVDALLPMAATGLVSGFSNSCATLVDGTFTCWGADGSGQLGTSSGVSATTAISPSFSHTCAILPDASVRCWGSNASGQLGDGTLASSVVAVTPSDFGITALSAGTHPVCVRTSDLSHNASDGTACATLTIDAADTTAPAVASFSTIVTSPTSATSIDYTIAFSEPVTGLESGDFTNEGNAAGCAFAPSAASGTSFTVTVSGCTSSGTLAPRLLANSVADAALNTGPSADAYATGELDIDSIAPAFSKATTVSLRVGVAVSSASATSEVPVTVSWAAADPGMGSGLDHYTLEQSLNGGAWAAIGLPTPLASSLATTMPSSGTVAYRVTAYDALGNSAASTGATLTPRLVQNTSALVKYKGVWAKYATSVLSGGSDKYSRAKNAYATYAFTGRAIGLVATKSKANGKVKVYVDGVLRATVNLYSATAQYRVVVWQYNFATSGAHTVKLVVAGTAGHPRVDLDSFVVVR